MSYFAVITDEHGMEQQLHATTDDAIEAADVLSTLVAYRTSTFTIVKCHIWIDLIRSTAMCEAATIVTINARNT